MDRFIPRSIYANQSYVLKICVLLVVSSVLIANLFIYTFYKPKYISSKTTSIAYNLDLPHCRIPEVPLEPQGYVRDIPEFISCENEDSFSTVRNGILHLDVPPLTNCCVSEILRPYEMKGDMFYRGSCVPINTSTVDVTGNEYIEVTCRSYKKRHQPLPFERKNFHAAVVPTGKLITRKIEYWKNMKKEKIPVNVFMLVLDSTTRKDALRHMPKTMDYLLNDLNFVDFKGFHYLGEATMPNAIPLLTGIPKAGLNEIKPGWTTPWDKVPFIWKDFHAANYVTAYTEDMPGVGTFNYGGQTGFIKIPTDFYLRPFFLANEKTQNMFVKKRLCVGKTTIDEFVLDYHLEILRKMDGLAPVFLINWPCWPQHDFFAGQTKLENSTLDFFKTLRKEPTILENTLIILMADHGFYRGTFANSQQGQFERKLPLFMIRVPSKLTSQYPDFAKRVLENSLRITTHYDVYKTLVDIVTLTSHKYDAGFHDHRKFGKSLLRPIEESRTCSDAGVPDNCCACNLRRPPLQNSNY